MLDHDAYRQELTRAHILLQPSKTAADGETEGGAPTVLLEAQATGLPVISTTHADIPEYVKKGESGLLVDEGDVRGLAEALESLITQLDVRIGMGKLGRLHVVDNYNVSSEARKLEDIYEEISI
jgi:colanic acid/amylovoran biosynthesis glycosyltransferase